MYTYVCGVFIFYSFFSLGTQFEGVLILLLFKQKELKSQHLNTGLALKVSRRHRPAGPGCLLWKQCGKAKGRGKY